MTKYLKFIISALLIIIAIHLLDLNKMFQMLQQVSATLFVVTIIINLVAFGVMGLRWHILASKKIALPDYAHLELYFKSTFFNTFSPANLGGDAYRFLSLKKHLASTATLIHLLIRERLFGLYGYVTVYLLAFFLIILVDIKSELLSVDWFLYSLVFACLIFFLAPFASQLINSFVWVLRFAFKMNNIKKLEKWIGELAGLFSSKDAIAPILLTFLGILLWILSINTVAIGFELTIPLLHLALIGTLVEIIRMLPITIQGVGLREGTFAYFLTFLGHNPEQSYVLGLTAYLALSISIILCGPIGTLIALLFKRKN